MPHEALEYDEMDQEEAMEVEESEETTDPLWLLKLIELPNIAELLDDEELGQIGARVHREYEIDLASRSDWDKTMKDAMDLAMQVKKDKTWPWPGAANQKFPVLSTAAIQFAARAYPAIVDGSGIVKGKINGSDEGEPLVNPQTGEPLIGPDGEPFWAIEPGAKQERADRVSAHMSWQLLEEMTEWEEDTDRLLHVLPITGVVFRKTWFDKSMGRNRSELALPKDVVVNYNAKSLDTAPRITHEFQLYPHEITERVRAGLYSKNTYGLARDAYGDEDAPHDFLEQHRLLDLDEDGYPEPYIVTIHKTTHQVARIVARFDDEGVFYDEDEDGQAQVVRIEPEHYWTKYGFIPNPESSIYDLGFGMLLMSVSDGINSILNQMLDAGTIQAAGGGFIGRDLRIKGGKMRFAPGEYKPVDVSGQKIADSIYHMQHAGPSPVMFSLLGLLIDAAQDITSVKDIMTGSEQSNAPATTTLALIEQGMKTFSSIFKRIHRSLKAEIKKLYRLNRLYLEPEVYFTFLDQSGVVAQQDYEDEQLDIVPVTDPTIVTDMQKLGRAQFLLQFNGDPLFDQMELRRRLLVAASIDGIDSLLVEPQPGPPPVEVLKEQREAVTAGAELALKREKQNADLASQRIDMVEKLASAVDKLRQSEGEQLTPETLAYLDELEVIANEMRGNDAGGLQPMANPPGDQGVPPVPAGPGADVAGGPVGPVGQPGAVPGPAPVEGGAMQPDLGPGAGDGGFGGPGV